MNFPKLDIPQTVKQVSDYLKTKCPNHKVDFGFGSGYYVETKTMSICIGMDKKVKVDTMIGNLSHIISAGYGHYILQWPEKYIEATYLCTTWEPVTYDTLLEMGCID